MRIGIDAHILGKNKGGVERYLRQLVLLLPQQMDFAGCVTGIWPKQPDVGRARRTPPFDFIISGLAGYGEPALQILFFPSRPDSSHAPDFAGLR